MSSGDATAYQALYAYTWDVGEVDEDRFSADLHRLGINTLSLAASYHSGKFNRPHGISGRVGFAPDGRASCRLRPDRYGAIQPEQSAEVSEDDVFGRYAARQDIAVNAWTVLLHSDYLGKTYPEAVVENAFGDRYWYSLCPSNPDVRAYAVALCSDIADRYPVASITIETPGWLPFRHGHHHEIWQIGPDPALEFNLGLCFCVHCMAGAKQAAIDVEGLRRRIASKVDAIFANNFDAPMTVSKGWMEADLLLDAELGAFMRWRNGVVTSLVAEIRAGMHRDAALIIMPSVQQPTAHCWTEGSDLAGLSKVADGLEICLYGGSWQSALADAFEVRRRIEPGALLRTVLRPAPPDYPEEGGFSTTVRALREAGLPHVGFYNYGHIRLSQLEWIGRALPARRGGVEE